MPTLLPGWKKRRQDTRTEEHWRKKEAKGPLNVWELYQKEWNFIEVEYDHQPSNNGLDLGNPAFAFDKKLAKYVKTRTP